MTHFDDEQLERAGRARRCAAMLLIAIHSGDAELQGDAALDYVAAGVTAAEIAAAKAELRSVYALEDCHPDEALEVLRDIATPSIADSAGPGPDAENHRVSLGIPLHPYEPASGPAADQPDAGDPLIAGDDPRRQS